MADIFVSYKKEDRALAADVIAQLDVLGYSVWWDQNLTPRETWDDLIKRELDAAKAVLVLWTPRSAGSEWVRIEANYAKGLNKLVPVKLEACGTPLAFLMRQTADLTLWDGAPDHTEWQKVLKWIGELVGVPSKERAKKIREWQEQKAETDALQEKLACLRNEMIQMTRERDQAMEIIARAESDTELVELRAEIERLKADIAQAPGSAAHPAPITKIDTASVAEPTASASTTVTLERNAAQQRSLAQARTRAYWKSVLVDFPVSLYFLSGVVALLFKMDILPASYGGGVMAQLASYGLTSITFSYGLLSLDLRQVLMAFVLFYEVYFVIVVAIQSDNRDWGNVENVVGLFFAIIFFFILLAGFCLLGFYVSVMSTVVFGAGLILIPLGGVDAIFASARLRVFLFSLASAAIFLGSTVLI